MGLWDVSHVKEIGGETKGKAVGKRGWNLLNTPEAQGQQGGTMEKGKVV